LNGRGEIAGNVGFDGVFRFFFENSGGNRRRDLTCKRRRDKKNDKRRNVAVEAFDFNDFNDEREERNGTFASAALIGEFND